jgi:hypothetical protein
MSLRSQACFILKQYRYILIRRGKNTRSGYIDEQPCEESASTIQQKRLKKKQSRWPLDVILSASRTAIKLISVVYKPLSLW